MKIDEVFEHIGANFGWYHRVLYLIVFVGGIPNAMMLLHFVYSHYEVDFHCKVPPPVANYSKKVGMSPEALLNLTIPMEMNPSGEWVRSQCKMYAFNYTSDSWLNTTTNKTMDCQYGYEFNLEDGQRTAIAEFEMVCGRGWMVPIAVSGVQAGMALGSFTGSLGDRIGRRPVFIGASAAQIFASVITAASWEYYSYMLANFFAGCATLVNFVIAFVLASEVIAVRWRNFIAISSFFSFGLGYCIDAGLGYMFPNWRHFLWAITVGSALFYLPTIWFLPESARWLMIKGHKEKGIAELKKMAKQNGCNFDVEEFVQNKMIDAREEKEKTTSLIQTFKILLLTKLRLRCLSVYFVWFVTGLAYYAISLYSTSFSDNRHLNLALAGISEFPALFVAYFAVKLSGRPRAAFILMFICGTSCLILPFLTAPEISTFRTLVAMTGKGAISAIFYVAYFLSAETTPTLQRSTSMSIASLCARIGGVGAPFLAYLGKASPFLPNLLMGATVTCAGFLCIFFVPETKGVPLPDSTEEALSNKRFYRLKLCRSLSPNKSAINSDDPAEI